MKKIIILTSILLLAASCNKGSQTRVIQYPPPGQNQQASSTPPNATAGWNNYTSPSKYGFIFKYPTEFGFSTDEKQVQALSYIPACAQQNMLACAYLHREDYKGTNFDGAGVSVDVDPTLNTEAKCYNFKNEYSEAQTQVTDVTINGVDFKSATGGGGAAGHFDKLQVYRNFHNNMCYEISQDVSEINLGVLDTTGPNAVAQFDESAVWQKLWSVIDTFEFRETMKSAYTPDQLPIKYNNTGYGFVFYLPADWKGFTIHEDGSWAAPEVSAKGKIIYIRNPKWTKANPYEDIPVMVFTLVQWDQTKQGQLATAAPFPPMEFDRNSKYVFALPPRFDYDFLTGYQEVENIVYSNPLKAY